VEERDVRNLTVLIAVSVASVGLCADPSNENLAALNGRWTSDSAVKAGEAYPDNIRKSIRLVLSKGKYTATVGEDVDEGTYKIDDSENPKTITFVVTRGPNKGKTIPGIYELDKGGLRICCDMSGKTRPTKFESKPDTQSFLASYHRQTRMKKALRPSGSGTAE
jgi:uncharacterized protein (TIGR03067 family)